MEKSLGDALIDKRYRMSSSDFKENLRTLGQLDRLISAKTIVIKPNFAAGSYVAPDSHVVTDTGFLRTLVEHIRLLNPDATIMIAESDSTGYGFAFLKFAHLGIERWGITGVKMLDVSRDLLERVENPQARYFSSVERQLWLSKALLAADYVISTANLKSHSVTRFTGACKNLFGLLPSMNKEQYHTQIHDVIHDLVLAIKVDLSIVDAFYAMEGNGPVQGTPVNLGYRIFSSSPVSADLTCCQAIGLSFAKVRYLSLLAADQSLLPQDEQINEICKVIAPPTVALRFFNFLGLALQSLGQWLYATGHRIHCADSLFNFAIALLRPLLLRIFSRQTLKSLKGRILNSDE